MQRKILDLLCCPNCKHDLELLEKEVTNGQVTEGLLQCGNCHRSFPIFKGVPRMMLDLGDRIDLAESWGYQWAIQDEGKLETNTYYGETEQQELDNFFNYLGIGAANLPGSVVLDAGCGCGRLTRALGKYGAEIIGIDIASSIERIHEYCQSSQNVHIIQADIANLPFKNEAFDYLWCKLAICYVHNPAQAFENLANLVRPSGRLMVAVPDKADLAFTVKLKDFFGISHRIPRRLLLYVSWCLAPALSLAKRIFKKRKTSLKSNAFFLFNSLHPSFMTRHTREEVIGWFDKNNFSQTTLVSGMEHLIFVRGTKQSMS
ncbi:MAG: methyltransferase domain-containing protein [Planctomycetes bacterium]|nr:methyltransferase domain-containing protein [Planctomycetota bacterium]